jgi:hypothetical protein
MNGGGKSCSALLFAARFSPLRQVSQCDRVRRRQRRALAQRTTSAEQRSGQHTSRSMHAGRIDARALHGSEGGHMTHTRHVNPIRARPPTEGGRGGMAGNLPRGLKACHRPRSKTSYAPTGRTRVRHAATRGAAPGSLIPRRPPRSPEQANTVALCPQRIVRALTEEAPAPRAGADTQDKGAAPEGIQIHTKTYDRSYIHNTYGTTEARAGGTHGQTQAAPRGQRPRVAASHSKGARPTAG